MLLLAAGGSAYVLAHGRSFLNPTAAQTTPTATAATTSTPGIPAGFHTYTYTDAQVQLIMPQDWTTTSSNLGGSVSGSTGVILVSPDETDYFLVAKVPIVGDNVAAASGFFVGAAGSSGTVANKVGPTNVSLAGETWVLESADVTRNGVTIHMVVLVTTHGGATYLLAYYAPPSSFASANTTYFQPMVHSLTFVR
jgi:hypothetical protein